MEKIELSVETTRGKKFLFSGKVDQAFVTRFTDMEKEYWELVLHYSRFVAFRGKFPFYPNSLVQQLTQQQVPVESFGINQMDIETQQALLELNCKP